MKELVLFLDFDGVLNCADDDFGRDFDSRLNTSLVNRLCDFLDELNSEFNIKVVVSSAWKTMLDKDDFLKRLKRHQDIKRLTDIISDITPTSHCCSKNTRGFEIEMYIDNNYNYHNLDNYVFLSIDDEKVETPHMSFVKHFRTNVSKGLMLYDIEKLKKILKEEKVG